MRPSPCRGVEALRPIDFPGALARLQAMLGCEVGVALNFHGRFFGAGFTGRLVRVETQPPDNIAVWMVMEGGQGLFLDPEDVEAYADGPGTNRGWLELWFGFGLTVRIETD